MVSIIILTKNEEQDIDLCLKSIAWCDDIHVLDSGSVDKTIEIAEKYGAKIAFHPFESFGKQRNYALEHLNVKYDWVLFLDADERSTPAFRNALEVAISNAGGDTVGYYCCWKMILEGRWLKRCDNFPKWQFRLLKLGEANFIDFGHGQKEGSINGKLAYIKEPYLHYGFSKGWTFWIERHNRYSSQEAKARLYEKRPFKDIFNSNTSIRNPALKSWLSNLPGWPLLRFFQAYVLKLGFLEGRQGFVYCVNMAYYEFLIKIKMKEYKSNLQNHEIT
ncbi:glycosyltransferase family 2 protein [Olivibacter sitiensis]|uniref:glycosyltransferase family 2 protein n=1 Tax=Olivibacter sitiensis TaxID=376470 RepID=UPI000402B4B7|nr:glycosyltransferase family 2 protein [Olivibacter sitiensis]